MWKIWIICSLSCGLETLFLNNVYLRSSLDIALKPTYVHIIWDTLNTILKQLKWMFSVIIICNDLIFFLWETKGPWCPRNNSIYTIGRVHWAIESKLCSMQESKPIIPDYLWNKGEPTTALGYWFWYQIAFSLGFFKIENWNQHEIHNYSIPCPTFCSMMA